MTTRYISPSGNDSTGTGAIGAPWRTFSKFLTAYVSGDTCEARGGAYPSASGIFTTNKSNWTLQNFAGEDAVFSRTANGVLLGIETSATVTVRKNPAGGSLHFTAPAQTVGTNNSGAGIQIYSNSSNVLIDGVIVDFIAGYGIFARDSIGITIQNCDVSRCGEGIRLLNLTSGTIYVGHNQVHDMDRMIINDPTSGNDFGGLGIAVDKGTDGAIVEYNVIHDCHATSTDYVVDGGAVEIFASKNTTFRYNTAYNSEGFSETGTDDAAGFPCDSNIWHHNVIYGQGSYITPPGGTAAMLLRAAPNGKVYCNTFYMASGWNVFRLEQGGSFGSNINNLSIRDNIVVSQISTNKLYVYNNTITSTGIVIDYNLLFNVTGSAAVLAARAGVDYTGLQLAAWQAASSQSAHDLWNVDPSFITPAAANFNLNPGSPAINTGIAIPPYTDGFCGPAPDIGAFETNYTYTTVLDHYNRTIALNGGLGTADVGGIYTMAGGAPFGVDPVTGGFTTSTAGQTRRAILADVVMHDTDVMVDNVNTDKLATGTGALSFYLPIRQQTIDADLYAVKINFTTTQTVTIELVKRVGSSESTIAGPTTIGGLVHGIGTNFSVRAAAIGASPTTVRGKVWLTAGVQPLAWSITTTDSAAAIQGTGAVGIRAIQNTGGGSGTVRFNWDELRPGADPVAPGPAAASFTQNWPWKWGWGQ